MYASPLRVSIHMQKELVANNCITLEMKHQVGIARRNMSLRSPAMVLGSASCNTCYCSV